MVKREVLLRTRDMLSAISEIEDFLGDASFDAYQNDPLLRRAIERCVEIISEASRHVPPDIQAQYPYVPWANIRAMGNILRHEYGHVDNLIVWRVAAQQLKSLKAALLIITGGDGDQK